MERWGAYASEKQVWAVAIEFVAEDGRIPICNRDSVQTCQAPNHRQHAMVVYDPHTAKSFHRVISRLVQISFFTIVTWKDGLWPG